MHAEKRAWTQSSIARRHILTWHPPIKKAATVWLVCGQRIWPFFDADAVWVGASIVERA